MKRQEFLAKYENTVICIPTMSYDKPSNEIMDAFNHIVKDMNFECATIPNFAQHPLELHVTIYTQAVASPTIPNRIGFTEFALDYKSIEQYELDELKETVKTLLSQVSITTKTISKLNNSQGRDLTSNGYIQSTTTKDLSLWWDIYGNRIVLVCGKGVFKLSNYNE